MAKFSKKVMGKEVGSADIYAKPHNMSGGAVDPQSAVVKKGNPVDALRPSIGGLFKSQPETKTDGIKIRGTGAATKGTMARGPMA